MKKHEEIQFPLPQILGETTLPNILVLGLCFRQDFFKALRGGFETSSTNKDV